jgi:gluconolactonase
MKLSLPSLFIVATAAMLIVPRAMVEGQAPPLNAVVRLDAALNAIVPGGAKAELLKGDYFGAIEGPVWADDGQRGYLLFSDMAANVIYKWTPTGALSVFLDKSGFTGADLNSVGGQYTNGRLHVLLIGSNGLTLDRQGRLIIAAMTDRSVTRLEKNGSRTTLVDKYEGKRLNSPNDLVVKSDGAIYFTETTSGMRGRDESPARELPFHGVYLIKDGALRLLDGTRGVGANGIASRGRRSCVNGGTRIELRRPRGHTIGNPRVLIDMSTEKTRVTPTE